MFIVWFEKHGIWHWIEVFQEDTANVVREALLAQGFEVTDSSHDPRKYSVIEQGAK